MWNAGRSTRLTARRCPESTLALCQRDAIIVTEVQVIARPLGSSAGAAVGDGGQGGISGVKGLVMLNDK